MFDYFKKRKNQGDINHAGQKITLTGKIKTCILSKQIQLATTLGKYEQRLNRKQKKIALFLFCFIMIGMSSFWLYQGISAAANPHPAYLKKNSIVQPENSLLPDSLDVNILQEYKRKWNRQRQHRDSIQP